jgi:hypothetical protein
MLFSSHANPSAASSKPSTERPAEVYGFEEGARKPVWQEVCHKARVRILRTPMDSSFSPLTGYEISSASAMAGKDGYAYHLEFVEDLDDGRHHDETGLSGDRFDSVLRAGIRESVPIHQISKIFYTDTGRLLNVGKDLDADNPVLLLKRDVLAAAPAKSTEACLDQSTQTARPTEPTICAASKSWSEQEEIDRQLHGESVKLVHLQASVPDRLQFPAHLDRKWIALEIFEEDTPDNDSESGDDVDDTDIPGQNLPIDAGVSDRATAQDERQPGTPLDSTLLEQMRNVCITEDDPSVRESSVNARSFMATSPFAAVTTSLSLLELLVRLLSLQVSQQAHHLTSSDAVLNFFLEDTSTARLSSKEGRRERSEAAGQIGFDPYEA